ncbi:MAG: hypothetical protein OHK0045_02650 [Raineya sp.]
MGNLLVKNYSLPANLQVSEVAQSKKGIVYFAHSEGVLSYDGLRWDNLSIGYSPRCLWIDQEENIWVAGKGFIGKLSIDIAGRPNFTNIPIPTEKEIGDIVSLAVWNNEIYFCSEKALIQYKNNTAKIVYYQEEQEILGWVLHQGSIFLNTADKGFCKLSGTSLQVLQKDFGDKMIHNFINYDEKNTLLSTSDNQLWLFDGKQIAPYNTYAAQYLQENFLEKVVNISAQELAISTLAGGVLILNKQDRSIRHIINYETGLADNEVSAIFTDQQKGLWICHAEGISRLALHLPIYNVSYYPGLEGKPYTVCKIKDLVYVATNSGLFYLSANNKDDVSGKVAQEKRRQMQQIAWQNARMNAQRKKLRLKNVVDKVNPFKKEETKEANPRTQVVTVVVESNVYNYNYSNYIIEKIPYNFRKINGIDSKCKQLIHFQERLIALTNTGLYEVLYGMANNIVEDRNIHYAEVSKYNPNVLYVATSRGAFWLEKTAEGWSKPNYIANIQGICFNVCQKDKNVWIAGEGKLWKVSLNSQGIPAKVENYIIEANSTMRVVVREINGELLFFTPKTVFIHKKMLIGEAFLPAKNWLSYGLMFTRLYINQPNYTWLNQGTSWEVLGNSKSHFSKYLPVLSEVQDLYQDENNRLWVATHQGVFLFRGQVNSQQEIEKPRAFVKKIQNSEGQILNLQKTSIESKGSIQNFSLQMAAPFFVAEENTQFQYLLRGLDDSRWSVWRKQASIDFSYLPSGNYELYIRAKNVLGELSETEVFSFEVAAPFWETWWFYLFQLGLMFGLLLAAVIYNRRGAESKVASVITLVALITIFEFVVLLLEPFIDDFVGGIFIFKLVMNILLAISLIPLEKRIRTYLQNSEYVDAIAQKIGFRKKMQDIKDYMDNIKELARNRRQE